MTHTVFIDGEHGTTGLQIRERLARRADLRLLTLPWSARKDPARRAQALHDCDVAVLCLPDAAAREAVASLGDGRTRIIDASSAHRTTPGWTYGLPELGAGQAARIAASRFVSNPGCYPTGAVALLRPLVDARLLPPDHPIAIHAVSGYSGKGREGVEAYERPGSPDARGAPALQVYGLGLDHKHVPEIQAHADLAMRPIFVPAYGAYRQGIVLTIPLHLDRLAAGTTAARVHDCLAAHYADTPAVTCLAAAESAALATLDPQALNGTDRLQLAVHANERAGQLLLSAVFDNLGKGAAGQAVQNLDLMLGGPNGAAHAA